MLFHATLAGAVAFGLMLPFTWGGPEPRALDITLLAAMGAVGGLGHFCFAAAFRYARASLLAPVNYLQIVWGAVLGFFIFGHVPDAITVAGMAVIAAAGVAVGLRAHFARG
jgi:drug/metabolite transporter (DMT)-like permease